MIEPERFDRHDGSNNDDDLGGTPETKEQRRRRIESAFKLQSAFDGLAESQINQVKRLPDPITVEAWRNLFESGSMYKSDRLKVVSGLFFDKHQPFLTFFKQHPREVKNILMDYQYFDALIAFVASDPNNLTHLKEQWIPLTDYRDIKREAKEKLVEYIFLVDEQAVEWAKNLFLKATKYNPVGYTTIALATALFDVGGEVKQWVIDNVEKIDESGLTGFWPAFAVRLIERNEVELVKKFYDEKRIDEYNLADVVVRLVNANHPEGATMLKQLVTEQKIFQQDLSDVNEALIKLGEYDFLLENLDYLYRGGIGNVGKSFSQFPEEYYDKLTKNYKDNILDMYSDSLKDFCVQLIKAKKGFFVLDNWGRIKRELIADRLIDVVKEALIEEYSSNGLMNLRLMFMGIWSKSKSSE